MSQTPLQLGCTLAVTFGDRTIEVDVLEAAFLLDKWRDDDKLPPDQILSRFHDYIVTTHGCPELRTGHAYDLAKAVGAAFIDHKKKREQGGSWLATSQDSTPGDLPMPNAGSPSIS